MTKRSGITAKEVAALAGVSQSTVSMILNNYENVSFTEETRQKVLAACNTLGYKGGTGSGTQNEKIILVVLPSCDNLSYAKQLSSVQSKAREYGYTCLTLNTFRNPKLENSVLQCIKSMPLAGSIFLYQPENISLLERAGALKPAVVVCDRNLNVKLDTIEVNSYGIGSVIAEHMIQLGHKNVAYIATSVTPKYVTRLRRLEGIKNAYIDHGYSEDAVKVITLESEGISPRGIIDDYTAGLHLTNRTLDKYANAITGIIGYNDMICFGIMDALKKRGFQVPQDYSLMGCDNIDLAEMASVSLTTVEHYPHLRARDATELLLKKISDNRDNTTDVYTTGITRVEYEPKMIVRSSTRSVKRSH